MAHKEATAEMSKTDTAPGLSPNPDPGQGPMPGRDLTDTSERVEVIAIFGPTGSGKTAVAEVVADALGTRVVSADAMQVYRGLPILTNQPERPMRLVAIRPLRDEMTVGAFASLAHEAIDELVDESGAAVVAGGTGLYLRAALAELDVPPPAAPELRARIEEEVDRDRVGAHERLVSLDPTTAANVHPNDRQRLVRALELAEAGETLTPHEDRLWDQSTRRPTCIFGLEVESDELQRRLRARAEEMFARGVVEEVRAALQQPVSRTAETLGLREIAELEPHEALERIVVRTRRYAAYQRKWMRRIPGIVMVDGAREPAAVAVDVLAHVRG